jgi:hypothetical protein
MTYERNSSGAGRGLYDPGNPYFVVSHRESGLYDLGNPYFEASYRGPGLYDWGAPDLRDTAPQIFTQTITLDSRPVVVRSYRDPVFTYFPEEEPTVSVRRSTAERLPADLTLLLATVLSRPLCEAIIGDLQERYAEKLKDRGRFPAMLWFWGQVITSLAPFAWAGSASPAWTRFTEGFGDSCPSANLSVVAEQGCSYDEAARYQPGNEPFLNALALLFPAVAKAAKVFAVLRKKEVGLSDIVVRRRQNELGVLRRLRAINNVYQLPLSKLA